MIEVLVGMIASGKSTYAKQRAKEGCIIVNDDKLTEMFHGDYRLYNPKLNDFYHDAAKDIIEQCIYHKLDVIVDRTCQKKSTRKRYIDIAKECGVEIVATKFRTETPEVHAKRRFESDSRGRSYEDWLRVANIHFDEYEELSTDEGFNRINIL